MSETNETPAEPMLETGENPAGDDAASAEARRGTFARRALLKSGWVVPAVIAFNLPRHAGSASPHDDAPLHTDFSIGPHGDSVGHLDGPP